MAQGEICQVASNCSEKSKNVYTNELGTFCTKHYLQKRRHGEVVVTNRDARHAVVEGDIAKIPLGVNAKDGYAIVDKEFAYLDQYKWSKSHWGYAVSSTPVLKLHRVVAGANIGEVVDHTNGDPLDNRKCNLRLCSQSENSKNQKLRTNNTTGYKGVYFMASANKYTAKVKNNYISYHIGLFDTAKEAAQAYNEKALQLHGKFARLNELA